MEGRGRGRGGKGGRVRGKRKDEDVGRKKKERRRCIKSKMHAERLSDEKEQRGENEKAKHKAENERKESLTKAVEAAKENHAITKGPKTLEDYVEA